MDWAFYQETVFPALNEGLLLSFKIIVPSAIFGFVFGILVGAGRAVGPKWLSAFLGAYVALFRGTPLITQLMIWYSGLTDIGQWLLPLFTEIGHPEFKRAFYLSPYTASVLAFIFCSAAYHSEYIRGAILSIKKGQFQAAKALGFTRGQNFWAIVVPQALRRALPGCGNEFIYLIKYSSLAFVVSCLELTGKARSLSTSYFIPLEVFSLAAVYYLVLVSLATWFLSILEKKYAIPH